MRSPLLKRIGATGMILSLVALLLTAGKPLLAATTDMTINVAKPGIHVSPNLWGIFFEEINYAGQGGLYAQLVKNGTFKWIDTQNHPAGWTLATKGGGQASLWVDSNHALNKINPLAARVTVYYTTPVGAVKLVNSGYWGMNFKKGESYKLSFYARKSAGMGDRVTAELLGADGTVFARKVISGISGKWTNFHAVLKSDGSDPQGKLAFVPTGHGSLYLNIVNLFPAKTWRGLPLRPQLARMLAALHPSFMRFPGVINFFKKYPPQIGRYMNARFCHVDGHIRRGGQQRFSRSKQQRNQRQDHARRSDSFKQWTTHHKTPHAHGPHSSNTLYDSFN